MRPKSIWLPIAFVLITAARGWATNPPFTLAPGSPSLGALTPADVLVPAVPPVPAAMPPPVLGLPGLVMFLGLGDVLNSISFGFGPAAPAPGLKFMFSVDGAAAGIPFIPPPANVACEAGGLQAKADVFLSQPVGPPLPFPNILALDENGLPDSPCGPPPFPGLGLAAAPPAENLNGLDLCPVSSVFLGLANFSPIYFTGQCRVRSLLSCSGT